MSWGEGRGPRKVREVQNHHMDSRIWDRFAFREDDVVIATYGKSGTTWLQQIVGQLIFEGAPEVSVSEISPWLDLRVPAAAEKLALLEAQTHRRFVKTHLPVDALVYSPRAKYLYIARDGRDVAWSLYNHHSRANALWYQLLNETPGRVGPPIDPPEGDVRQYFLRWLEEDGYPFWPFWSHIASWWRIRAQPNLLLLHYQALKRDLPTEIRRIAGFLDLPIPEARWPAIQEHCGFDFMKAHAERSAPLGGALWEGGGRSFIHRGTDGRWRDVLSPAEIARYEALAVEKLGPDCAHWLATGRMAMPAA